MILYIEDDKAVQQTLRAALEEEGWLVEVCEDGLTALEKLKCDLSYCLIILDYDLPCINGIELLRRIRSLDHRCHTPVLMLTATECEAEACAAGVDAFLRKPVGLAELSMTIAVLCTSQRGEEWTARETLGGGGLCSGR